MFQPDSARTTEIDFHQTSGRKYTPGDPTSCICAECWFRIRFSHCLLGFKPRSAKEQLWSRDSIPDIWSCTYMGPGLSQQTKGVSLVLINHANKKRKERQYNTKARYLLSWPVRHGSIHFIC